MIEQITFENFRGLKRLALEELRPITLISGKNNAGKSSILEGIFLMFDHLSPESFVKINRFRGLPVLTEPAALWAPMFYDLDTDAPLRFTMRLDGVETVLTYTKDTSFVPYDATGAPQDILQQFISSAKSSYTLKLDFRHGAQAEEGHFITSASGVLRNVRTDGDGTPPFLMPFTQFINSAIISNDEVITEWFGKVELDGRKEQVVELLKLIDPSVRDVTTIMQQGQSQLYARMGTRLLPLKLAGDGINKLLFIALAVIANPGSLILIDEIETGFHYSMYPKLWEVIGTAARENGCQIVATTHSYECIAGAIDGIEQARLQELFCYYRIERRDGENLAFRYSGDLLDAAIDSGMEVR